MSKSKTVTAPDGREYTVTDTTPASYESRGMGRRLYVYEAGKLCAVARVTDRVGYEQGKPGGLPREVVAALHEMGGLEDPGAKRQRGQRAAHRRSAPKPEATGATPLSTGPGHDPKPTDTGSTE